MESYYSKCVEISTTYSVGQSIFAVTSVKCCCTLPERVLRHLYNSVYTARLRASIDSDLFQLPAGHNSLTHSSSSFLPCITYTYADTYVAVELWPSVKSLYCGQFLALFLEQCCSLSFHPSAPCCLNDTLFVMHGLRIQRNRRMDCLRISWLALDDFEYQTQ
jgi:hypothetical protein